MHDHTFGTSQLFNHKLSSHNCLHVTLAISIIHTKVKKLVARTLTAISVRLREGFVELKINFSALKESKLNMKRWTNKSYSIHRMLKIYITFFSAKQEKFVSDSAQLQLLTSGIFPGRKQINVSLRGVSA